MPEISRPTQAAAAPVLPAPEIHHEVRIRATPAAIYRALTDVQQLGAWWIPDTRGESKPGATLEFWFNPTAHQDLRVAALEPDRLVRWQALAADLSDWAGTEIEFRIVPGEAETRLQFRHFGWRHAVERFPYYSLSWAVFLLSLKDLLEKGQGHPFPNAWIH